MKYFLEQCLYSVKAAISNMEAEVIVVDNASSDGSVQFLKDQFSWIKFIELNENIGFGRANNVAVKEAEGRYILFLNPDTIVPENAFKASIDFMEERHDAGALGVRMIDGAGNFLPESKRSLPTPVSSFYKLSGLASLFPRSKRFNKYALGHIDERSMAAVDVLSGAYFLCSRKILEKVGGFDEAFFMYGEDIDLSYRISTAGFLNFYFGRVTIIHFKGESAKAKNVQYLKSFYGAMEVFVNKHYRSQGKLLVSYLLKAGVFASAMTSALIQLPLQSFRKIFKSGKKRFLFEGDEEAIEEAKQIMAIPQNGGFTITNKEVASPSDNLVFCQGTLSFHEIISRVEQNDVANKFYFHAKGSHSVIGSESKDRPGIVYHK